MRNARRVIVSRDLRRELSAGLWERLEAVWIEYASEDVEFPAVPAGAAQAIDTLLNLTSPKHCVALINEAHSREPRASLMRRSLEKILWLALPLVVGNAQGNRRLISDEKTMDVSHVGAIRYRDVLQEIELWWLSAFTSFLDGQPMLPLRLDEKGPVRQAIPSTGKPIELPTNCGNPHRARVDLFSQLESTCPQVNPEAEVPMEKRVADSARLAETKEHLKRRLRYWATRAAKNERRKPAVFFRDLREPRELMSDLHYFSEYVRYFNLQGCTPGIPEDEMSVNLFALLNRIAE